MDISLNTEQKLYVISSGNGVSCLGFEVVHAQAKELATRLSKWLKRPSVRQAAVLKQLHSDVLRALRGGSLQKWDAVIPSLARECIGTLEQYNVFQELLQAYRHIEDDATWYDERTPLKVRKALEDLRKAGDRTRAFFGDPKTGRDWLEEFDTIGYVRRSCGYMKTPQLVSGKREIGGPSLLTHCIVRLVNLETGEEVYTHPSYHRPPMFIEKASAELQAMGYTHSVMVEEKPNEPECHANFHNLETAAHWLTFMTGNCHEPPRDCA